ncbi:MAG TPA: cyclodeaminase/cyclohydrolase family protein [Candidatus Limnocylindrales bacterium]|nr:cyclodeaminase/cyclohydrolase family protein [Candidatus Limnocylindrales bacterium]
MDSARESFARQSLGQFSERLASGDPVPGGGSASAVAASLAASLLAMVARLSLDRPKYGSYRTTNERALEVADDSRLRLLDLADADALAYGRFSAAMRMSRDSDEERTARDEALRAAAREASEVPLTVLEECARLLDEIESVAGRSNLNASSDLEVAARLCAAAARGAAANVMINLPHVGDERFAGGATARVESLLHMIERDMLHVSQRVAGGGLREPEQR